MADMSKVGAFAEPTKCKCYAAMEAGGKLVPFEITRRAMGADDVVIEIKFAGICHSDIHQVLEEWGKATFPMVPGHEIGGVIVDVGANAASRFAVGQHAGVGCMVDSCRKCSSCVKGEEQYCSGGGCTFTYNSTYKYAHASEYNESGGAITYGGYSKFIVVNKDFCVSIPMNLDLAGATPLLCAGITTFSPLMHYGLTPVHRFAVVGLGGLGHMAVKFGKAFGAHTTVISRGLSKRDLALTQLGADAFLDSTDEEAMKAAAGSFDFILNAVSAQHDLGTYIGLLDTDGKMVVVGVPPAELGLRYGSLIFGRKSICGSLIGGVHETQQMMDFCGRKNIVCDIETIQADYISTAYDRTIASDVKFRFVIDTASI